MYAFIEPFVQIALLRRTPQDIPSSRLLLQLTLMVHALLSIAVFALQMELVSAVLAGVLATVILSAMTVSLLFATGLSNRIVQTLTAMAGCDAVVTIVALPLTVLWLKDVDSTQRSGLVEILLLSLLIWNLVVIGHVLRNALSTTLAVGIALALIFILLSSYSLHSLFPALQ